MLKYLRLHVLRRDVAPGPKRELLTLAYTIDHLFQRDILGALDIIMQRVKSLELVVGGSSWAAAQNLELVPLEQEKIASIAEAHAAAKEFKQDARVQRVWERQREMDRGLEGRLHTKARRGMARMAREARRDKFGGNTRLREWSHPSRTKVLSRGCGSRAPAP